MNVSLPLKPSLNLELLINHFNNASPENGNHPEKIASSKYYDIDEMHKIVIPHKNKSLSLFLVNACKYAWHRFRKAKGRGRTVNRMSVYAEAAVRRVL